MFPNRVPMDRDTLSPEPVVYSFIHSFNHACLPKSPKRSPPTYGTKHKVTNQGAPCRWKAYIQQGAAWSPKGIVNDTAISTPVPRSFRHDTFHLCSHVNHCCVGHRTIMLKPQATVWWKLWGYKLTDYLCVTFRCDCDGLSIFILKEVESMDQTDHQMVTSGS
jgi:hypothetical protein